MRPTDSSEMSPRQGLRNAGSSARSPAHCIIAGAPRSGTTSLFEYLAAHPQVAPSYAKQTGFFLDRDYPGVLEKPPKHHASPADDYTALFRDVPDARLRLECTPDYLYSLGSARAIHERLGGEVKLLFVLRDPAERLVSLFHHLHRIGGDKAPSGDLQAFVDRALAGFDPQAAELLEKGEYARYLDIYFDLFGGDSISVVFAEELRTRPREILGELSGSLGIDPRFYDDYRFEERNRASRARSRILQGAYRTVRRFALSRMAGGERSRALLEPLRRIVSRMYRRTNVGTIEPEKLSTVSRARLVERYLPARRRLERMLGRDVPWRDVDGVEPT